MDHSVAVEVSVGRRKYAQTIGFMDTDTLELDHFGSVWGERQILHLGSHFDLYSAQTFSQLGDAPGPGPLGRFTPHFAIAAATKIAGTSVSGNFGEVLTIMLLQRLVPPWRRLKVCHLTPLLGPTAQACPDLLTESTPLQQFVAQVQLPPVMPVECKNSDFLGGLRQLCSYWQSLQPDDPGLGYGMVSLLDYRNPPSLTLCITVPIDRSALYRHLQEHDASEVRQRDLGGMLSGF